jgi:hypothetical protein
MESHSSRNFRSRSTTCALLIGFFAAGACGRAGLMAPNPEAVGGSSDETGGVQGSGGTSGLGTGGLALGSGGRPGSGGLNLTGGTGQGGTRASGGILGSGGTGGKGSGGVPATGGTKASGGTTTGSGGTGGKAGSGGTVATGGIKATGGTVATGGSSTGGSGTCSDMAPCGGDAVGTWNVTSSCLSVSGQYDMAVLGLGCTSAQITGSLQVTGDWTAKSNGRYTDNTTTSGTQQLTLPASCLLVAGTTTTCERIGSVVQSAGYDSVSCKALASGGCACTAIVKQVGWPGLVTVEPPTSGKYATSGTTITLDGEASYSYCVSGDKMTWTPQSKYSSISGAIVFQKTGTGG